MISSIFPSRYLQGPGIFKSIFDYTKDYGKKGLAICSPYVFNEYAAPLFKDDAEACNLDFISFNKECSYEEIDRLTDFAKSNGNDFIVGFGGGKTLDTSRVVAIRLNIPQIIVPSIASTDAPTASVSVVYNSEGEVRDILVFKKNPDLVLLDTEIIAKAPTRYLVSGMGDGLATWLEAEACIKTGGTNITGFRGTLTAFAVAKLCFDTILEYGYPAKLSNQAGVVTPALEHVVEANTLMSGIGFESGGLGAAHAIHNGFVMLPETKKFFHGEKVALGMLASLFLSDRDSCLIEKLFSFCEKVGLPTTFEDIGIVEPTDEKLKIIAERACAKGESIYNEAPSVVPAQVFSALKLCDLYGKNRKHGN